MRDSNVIRLSVDTNTVLSLVSKYCIFLALLVLPAVRLGYLSNALLICIFCVSIALLSVNMAIPDPTPCSL